VTTYPTPTALLERYTLFPGVGVGAICFGDRVADHPDLELRDPEPPFSFDSDLNFAEYTIAGLEEILVIFVDEDGLVDSVGFCETCMLEDRDLIGMGVGELLVLLGLPSAIEAEDIGDDIELSYAYDALGIALWTIDGEVCVVQAGVHR